MDLLVIFLFTGYVVVEQCLVINYLALLLYFLIIIVAYVSSIDIVFIYDDVFV